MILGLTEQFERPLERRSCLLETTLGELRRCTAQQRLSLTPDVAEFPVDGQALVIERSAASTSISIVANAKLPSASASAPPIAETTVLRRR